MKGEVKKVLSQISKDLYYSIKSLRLLGAKFVALQECVNDGEESWWIDIDERSTCPPYYVCALFDNGKHLPLPLVLGEKSEYPMQNFILKILRSIGILRQAEKACLEYLNREV